MTTNKNRMLPRRSARDAWWLVKHFFWPITVRPYEYPEDFWLGSDKLWVEKSTVSWKFLKLWWCYSLNSFCAPFFVVLSTHIGALLIRPDVIGLFDMFNARTFSGIMFYGAIALATFVGAIFVLEHLVKEKK